MLKKLVFLGAWAVVLTGCGGRLQDDGSEIPSFLSPPTEEQLLFLKHFPLLNQDREEAPPTAPDGSTPFGVLVVLRNPGEEGNFCSAAHISPGYVTTNAHCVPDYRRLGAGRFFLIHYNKWGEKVNTPVESFHYVGDHQADDIAVLKIPDEAAAEWDVAGSRALSTQAYTGTEAYVEIRSENGEPRKVLRTFGVSVWGFDPFKFHPDLTRRFGGMPGMWFRPETCVASRRKPTVVGVTVPAVGPVQRTELQSPRSQEKWHVFLDQCSEDLKSGNSGSIITLEADFGRKVGVYHWGIQPVPGQHHQYDYYEYTGNSARLTYLEPDLLDESSDFFGVGFTFENLSRGFPGLSLYPVPESFGIPSSDEVGEEPEEVRELSWHAW